MFFRVKSAGSYQYLQIVHSVRQGEKVRQQVFGTLGRLDELKASGRLEALIRSRLRHCEKFALYRCACRRRDSTCHGPAYSRGHSITAPNSPLEQDHRAIKRRINASQHFRPFSRSFAHDRRLRDDPYDSQRSGVRKCGGCEGRYAAPLHC
jgi:hypothetical protein